AWHDMHLAYRTPNAIYLYVRQNQAYLLNDSLDAAWSLLQASLPAERLHDMR
ncbi:MAG: YcxB family protein, partial [Faecalibacterium prausnitzii]|nr:YcxB family protein [Faecalibacterium prausnitzii]